MANTLASYFSASGKTENVARLLAKALGADIFEIEPEIPYKKADLNWMDKNSRSTLEMKDRSSRPEIKSHVENMEQYSVIFLGFPIWWYREPSIIDTFLEEYDFAGKTIVLFATSGGSGFGKTAQGLKGIVSPQARIIEGKLLNGRQDEKSLAAWADSLGL